MAKSPCVWGLCSVLAIGLVGCATQLDPPRAGEPPAASTARAAPAALAAARGTAMRVEGLFSTATVGRRTADGKIVTECVDGTRPAASLLQAPPAPAARREAM